MFISMNDSCVDSARTVEFETSRAFGRVLLVLVLAATACARHSVGQATEASRSADLVLRGGKVVTMDPARPEAQAVAAQGDRIIAVGTNDEIARVTGPQTRVIELGGRLVVPGFIEGHGHFMSLGKSKMMLDLTRAKSWDDIVAMVGEAARNAKAGAWILGRGWHQEKWERVPTPNVDGVPLHHELSRVSPQNPVILTHASGHAGFANAKALELAGVGPETADPPGGTIVRDAQRNPTGLLRETAQRLVGAALARAERERPRDEVEAEMRRQVELAGQEALSKGVTTFHDAGSPFAVIDFFKRLADEGKLPMRLYVMVRGETNEEMEKRLPSYRLIGYGSHHLTVRSIKRQIDGALGSHGAWLLEPYDDLPSTAGLNLEKIDDIKRAAEIAIRNGFQVNTHAIGDRANREILDLYESVFRAHPDKSDLRWRIEHAQHLDPADIPRFKRLGVIASMQGIHCTSDGPWVPRRVGEERARDGAYVWRKLLDAGALVTNGTDVPVEDIDPIAGFHASVTRRMKNGQLFFPEQRLTRDEALRSYTVANAFSAFEEDIKGMLGPGKLADMVVLSQDILTVADDDIPKARVDHTIVGGQMRYSRQRAAPSSSQSSGR
jgi:predicted amidohydrolase YtcJ